MNDIIHMAREAGFATEEWGDGFHVCVFNFQSSETDVTNELARFAALVRADEREQCAKVAEETVCDTHLPTGVKIYGARAAAAIRARKEA